MNYAASSNASDVSADQPETWCVDPNAPVTPPASEILRALSECAEHIDHTEDGMVRLTLLIAPELIDHWAAAESKDVESP